MLKGAGYWLVSLVLTHFRRLKTMVSGLSRLTNTYLTYAPLSTCGFVLEGTRFGVGFVGSQQDTHLEGSQMPPPRRDDQWTRSASHQLGWSPLGRTKLVDMF